jgi:hypothetical protein
MTLSTKIVFALIVVAAATVGCSRPAITTTGCTVSSDCGDNQQCDTVSGQCLCLDDSACDPSEFCNAVGKCQTVLECLDNSDCTDSELCDTTTGSCLASVPGITTSVGQPIEHRLSHVLSGTPAALAVVVQGNDLAQLRELQDYYLRYPLSAVDGVAEVASFGGFVKQYQVAIDPERLRAHSLRLDYDVEAIENSNSDVGGSVIERGEQEYMVRSRGYLKGVDDLRNVPVGLGPDGAPVMPKLKLNTTRQGMMRCRAKFNMPPNLVPAANSKSVPTAKAGLMPKPKISSGVMSEPPPTPVRPTMKPTTKPAKMNAKFSIRARL